MHKSEALIEQRADKEDVKKGKMQESEVLKEKEMNETEAEKKDILKVKYQRKHRKPNFNKPNWLQRLS